jgi:hypothetical protein
MSNYNFTLITIVIFTAYFLSFYLAKTKKITQIQHRRFWNFILLISFLVSGILGLILAFFIDQKISFSWYLPFLWFHVEFGIIMSLISIFHIIWHLPYYKSILKSQTK